MSSLDVFLSPGIDQVGVLPSWHTLHVPPSKHDIKPFLSFLRQELNVTEEYGFKLAISQSQRSSNRSPLEDPSSLKPITTVNEFQSLFETLEWQEDGNSITLCIELKKKDPGAIAAAAAASASTTAAASSSTPKFQAPSKSTAKPIVLTQPTYVPVQAHHTTTSVTNNTTNVVAVAAAPTPVVVAPTPVLTYAQQNRFNQSDPKKVDIEPATRSVTDKLAMFGGASIAVSQRVYNQSTAAPSMKSNSIPPQSTPSSSSNPQPPPPPSSTTTPPPPAIVPSSSFTPLLVTPSVSSISAPFSASLVRVGPSTSSVATSNANLISSLQTLTLVAPPQPAILITTPLALDDPDLDLPPPPSGFQDPFANGGQPPPPPPPQQPVTFNSHPPLPVPPSAQATLSQPPPPPPPSSSSASIVVSHPSLPTPPPPPPPTTTGGITFQVAKVIDLGSTNSHVDADLPPPPPPPPSAAPPSAASLAPLSQFLHHLKPFHAQLIFLYAHDSYDDMIELCQREILLYETECLNGLLPFDSLEKQQASNGILLYLFHLSLAFQTCLKYEDGLEISKRFIQQYEALPPILQMERNNISMKVQLLHNIGLTLEGQGNVEGAISNLTQAVDLIERTLIDHPDGEFDHRSDIYSTLGNLYTSRKDFETACDCHLKAMTLEDLKQPSSKRKWLIYHAAGSSYAQKGDFKRAIECDSNAIDLILERNDTPDPRIYFNRGLCYQRFRSEDGTVTTPSPKFEESIQDFTRVIQLDSHNFPKAYILRAKGYLQQQQWLKVIEDCQMALRLLPQDLQAREFLNFARQQMEGQ